MVGLVDNIIGLIKQSMYKYKTNLYVDGTLLGLVPVRNISRWLVATITVCNSFVNIDSCIERNRNGEKSIYSFKYLG